MIVKHFNGEIKGVNYRSMDSILCDWCIVGLRRPRVLGQEYKEIIDKCRNEVNSKVE